MIIDDDKTKKFTKTCKCVSLYLPIFERYIPGRYKKFLKHAGDETLAKRGLKFGDGPKLIITKTETVPGHPYTSNGFFWANFDDRIFLEERNAAKFEKDNQTYEICLQYLLLHEMIHWVKYHAKLNDDDSPGGLGDSGDAFERDAYGRDMSHYWDSKPAAYDRGNLKL